MNMAIEYKASKLVEFIKNLPDFHIVDEIDSNYNHIGATIADAVLQANMKYESHVRPRINKIRRNFPEADTIFGLKRILSEKTAIDFLNWRGVDRVKRFQAIVDLLSSEKINTEDDLRCWLMNDINLTKLRRIHGIGPKTIDYFKILTGIQTSAIDRHLHNFLERANISVYGYDEAKDVINKAADKMNVPRSHFDHSIWKYMSTGASHARGTDDKNLQTRRCT